VQNVTHTSVTLAGIKEVRHLQNKNKKKC